MSDSMESRDPLDQLGEEFLARLRRGEAPIVSEFAARDPEHAGEVRDFLSALILVEGIRPQFDLTVDAARAGPAWAAAPPERVGDFRVLRELGRGGMGLVYEAEQESLGRVVALKVLAPGVARTPQQVQRFVREARAAARLHHSNIVPVFGVGEHEGLHYYAMQRIAGLGLDKVLDEVRRLRGRSPAAPCGPSEPTRRHGTGADDSPTQVARPDGPRPAGDPPSAGGPACESSRPSALAAETGSHARYARGVARIGLQVAEALGYAHQQGTLHRDVKPSNILLDVNGVAWVTDFGLAKAAEDDDLTRTGDVVGTIRYMAPERFRGQGDARSDVYGLGLVLYELLALRPAFLASDRDGLFYQVNHVPVARLRAVSPSTPRDLETIVHKAIEKDPAHRYASAAALAEDLRRFLEGRPIVARRVGSTERLTRWAWRNPGLATLGTALAGMLALVVVVIAAADLGLRQEHAATLENLGRAERAEGDALARLLDSYVAQARASRRSRFAGRRAEGLHAIEQAAHLDPRRERLMPLRNEAIACMALPDLRPLDPWPGTTDLGFFGADFDPTTGRMARGMPDGSIQVRRDESRGEPITLPGNGLRVVSLRFSPDGRSLVARHDARGKVALAAWDVARRAKLLEVPDGMYSDAADFHPDGRTLAVGRTDGAIVLYDLATGQERRRHAAGPVPAQLRYDPSGRRLAVVSPTASEGVQVRRDEDGAVVASWSLGEPLFAADWSPDGRRLAVGTYGGRVLLLDPDDPARAPRAFGGHDGQVVALAFHPGGHLIASGSWDGTLRLWNARSGEELVRGPYPEARRLRFSRDGRLLGPGVDAGTSWLWEMIEGVECRTLLGDRAGGDRIWSADFLDGGDVVVSATGPGLRLEPASGDGETARASLPGTKWVLAAPDGSSLVTSGESGVLRWPVGRASGGELRLGPPRPLGPLPGVPAGRVRLSRDGRTLAAVMDERRGSVVVFDADSRRPPVELAGHELLERVALSPDGRWVATGTWRGTGVKVWDARSGRLERDLPVEDSAEVVFSPDGRWLVTTTGGDYSLWEVGSWSPRLRLPRSQAANLPGVAAFTPDGGVLAIARTRWTVQLIVPATGRELATLGAPDPQNVTGLAFSPDGRRLVVTFNAAHVQVWDVAALRRGLARLNLDWSTPRPPAASAGAGPGPRPIAVEEAPWDGPLAQGEALARSGRLDEAATALDRAIAAGAPGVEARLRRALFARARGDASAYREACHELLRAVDLSLAPPRTVNDVAWACVLGDGAVDDYDALVGRMESAASRWDHPSVVNTLGAVLYRAGRADEAVRQLDRSVAARGGVGTPYDALFLALAHHRLGHAEEARRWLGRGRPPEPVAAADGGKADDPAWSMRLELGLLRREAEARLGPARPCAGGAPGPTARGGVPGDDRRAGE